MHPEPLVEFQAAEYPQSDNGKHLKCQSRITCIAFERRPFPLIRLLFRLVVLVFH